MDNLARVEAIACGLPETARVDIARWGGEPTFRVGKKVFVFAGVDGDRISVKLSPEEADAVVATEPGVESTGHGIGRAGWVTVTLGRDMDDDRWELVREWIHTSYRLVAPKRLSRLVED